MVNLQIVENRYIIEEKKLSRKAQRDAVDSKWIVACLNTGHAVLVKEEPVDFIRKLGARLQGLHIHDLDGNNDNHTLPYYGIIDWDRVAAVLKEINYDGSFNYEVSSFTPVNLPKELYPAASRYMAEVGRYLISKIQSGQ